MRNTLGNIIQETKEFINNVIELKKKNREEFIRINNEMLEILRLEEEAKAKIEVLKKGRGVNV
ncbi:hypothetical protein ACV3RY_13355 [Clostridium perfringens]